ncbi:hypothetical protein LTR36_006024 [Oleoguttula mirabilis]|uniref:SMP-30/Gluconolactonase/LRE-like region domain-containing protein n=1 Tax=Oleoguttula mirabilis TaxID=1507867 RepID=A0AAV9JD01_9PEZI|nr:hypothetical protein LTR36_006024 [Oleoguttula mirabilis]
MVFCALTLAVLIGVAVEHARAYNTTIFQVDNPAFDSLLGPAPQVIELATSEYQLFHEGGVYHAPTHALWVVSDDVPAGDNQTNRYISCITGFNISVTIERIVTNIPNPVGAHRYITGTPYGDVILFVAQGSLADTPPAGVYMLNPYAPYNTSLLLGSYGDYPFNSPDDIAVTSDGIIWFTDPPYGYNREIPKRSAPVLPNQVYAYDPRTSDLRVVADGFGRPNGIAASPNGKPSTSVTRAPASATARSTSRARERSTPMIVVDASW